MGDTLSLFAVGIALFALFVASYCQRGTWITLGSTTLTMALLFGCLVLVTAHDRNELRTRLAWVAGKLPVALDRETVDQLAAPLSPGQAPASRPEREPMQAATAPAGWFDAKPDPKADPQSPVAWDLDQPDIQAPVISPWGLSIGGTNVSGQTLEQVEAVLKPDATGREFELALDVEGRLVEDGPVIPAGARFSLISANPNEDGSSLSGAILSFRYVQAGQRKTSILYLTRSMLARFADRG